MAQTDEIIINVDAEKAIKRIEELAKETEKLRSDQTSLAQAYADGSITLGEYTKAMTANKLQIKDNEKQTKALTAQVDIAIKKGKQYGDTLNDERAKLRDMQNAYASMDAAFRESRGGKQFLAQIKEQSDKVKEMEKAMGDARRNVGNYGQALEQAGVGVGGFAKKMKALWANPWAAIIGAVVVAIKAIVDAFKRSEDRMRELNKAIAPVRGALDVLRQLSDKLAKRLSEGLVVVMGKLTEGLGWIAKQLDKLGKKVFKQDWGLAESFEKAGAAVSDLTDKEQKYQDHRRRFVEQEAKTNLEIAKLRDQVAQKDKYTTDERLAFLDEISKKELYLANERKRLAQENLAILQADAERSENDAETNDALAQAKADVINAEAAYYAKEKEISAQIVAVKKEIESADNKQTAEEKKNNEERIKLARSEAELALNTGIEKLGKDKELTEEAYNLNMEYFASLLSLYEQDSTEYNKVLADKAKYNAEYNEKVRKEAEETAKKEEAERKKAASASVQGFQTAANSAAQAFNDIANMAEEGSDAQKAAAVAGVVASEASALAAQGKAMAEAIAGATAAAAATGPAAPFTLAGFIATMVATVISGIVGAFTTIRQAKSIIAGDTGKYATGGVIPGNSYSGDRLTAHVDSGEVITPMKKAAGFYDIVTNPDKMLGTSTAALASAIAAMPAPVVVYKELRDFDDKVATYNEIASI